MTETVSNVYDLIYPSPATLKEISCNALVTGLWRWEVENRVTDNFISVVDMRKNLDPNIPSPIKRIIEECADRFIESKRVWWDQHEKLFSNRSDINGIIFNYCDFIIDRDGEIHYTRTAKRMMTCDLLSDDEKFKIACMYCFEDDIRRIWPSVSEKFDLDEINFDRSSHLFYWICMLRNEPNRIPYFDNDRINEFMLNACPFQQWSSKEYFWNRISSPESRFTETISLSRWEKESFVRSMLPKLSDQLLEDFVLERGDDLIYDLVTRNLIELFIENSAQLEDETYLCCEIWRNSPDEWKRSTARNILTQDHLFVRDSIRLTQYREIRFLLTLLSDASFKERNDFWKMNWRNLIVGTRVKDLHRIMKLCFKDENDIAKFKEASMCDLEGIDTHLRVLLRYLYFEKVNDLLTFCCPDSQKRMDLKQRFLRSCISAEYFYLKIGNFSEFERLNEFINDACDNAEVAADLKNRIISFCRIENILYECIYLGSECSFDHFTRFLDTFVSNEEVKNSLKQSVLEYVRSTLLEGFIGIISADGFQKILVWCLGNEEEVAKFKKSLIPMSDFFANDNNWRRFTPLDVKINDRLVGGFLKWYFRNPEEIDEFNRLFADRL
ncbi:uncharacterized protein LOC135834500 isoform X28 [Planococcus citri]|uniref:uncharacterized protein LOC135834500 isoform X28 n=1 Tax=Planococcus citri TaxID=170843 RepID=UPI0031F81D22